MKHLKEQIMKVIFFIAACTSVLAVALICIFLFANGLPAMEKIGLGKFLTGVIWKPSNNIFGILPMIMGSIYVTAGAIIIGVPIGLCTAVFMAHYCPKKIYGICKAAVNLMAGVPSVVYGFFGLVCIVPLMQDLTGHDGSTMLTASILLGIMILPTIVSVCEAAIRSVPTPYYEGALALGATPRREAFSLRSSRRQSPVSWQVSCWASAGRSERRWQLSWLRAIRHVCQRASHEV